jgi:hypothetical protein
MAWYIALAPYAWGKSQRPGDAVRRCRKMYPNFAEKAKMPYYLYEVPADAYVDNEGRVCSDTGQPKKIRYVDFVGGQRIVKEKFDEAVPPVPELSAGDPPGS